MRAATQAAQGAQPQPKVADQAIAQMAPQQLPEDVGIGQLRAPNMQFGAEGGIMGYDEGYDEGGMTYGQEPVMMMAGGGAVERYQVGGATKAGPEFMRFLKQKGFDLVEFSAMDPDGKAQLVDMFEQSKTATPAATTSAAPAAQTPTGLDARKTYAPSKAAGAKATALLGKAVTTGKKFTPAGLGIEALTAMGDYKVQDPDGIDTSLAGTVRDLSQGEFGRAGTGMVRGVGEAVADVGSFGANMLDYVVPGEAPVSRAYEEFLARNTNLQGPRARALANVPAAPSGATLRSQLNRSDAATYAQPGVDNAPAAAGPTTAAGPSTARPLSTLSGDALSGGRTGAGISGGASAAGKDPFSMASIKAAQKEAMGDSNYEIGAMRNQLAEFKSRAEQRAQDAIDRRTKEIADEGDVYKDRSDRLGERGKKLTAQKEENTGLAFLNAGLAMMSTPGGFAAALGKGAQVGTAQYAAGLKDLRAAQERLDEANERIEDLRMNRKDMNKRDIRALEKDRDAALADGDKMTFAFAKDMYGLNRADATAAFNAYSQGQKTVYEQDAQTRRTMATINASTDGRTKQLWKGLMQKHNNDPVAAAKEYNAIEAGDKPTQVAEKMVQDRVGEWEKANKLRLSMMKPAEQAAELRSAEQRLRNDIYTQLKLSPTMGAGASSSAGFKFRGVEPAQ